MRLERFQPAHIRLFEAHNEKDTTTQFMVADPDLLAEASANAGWSAFDGDIFLGSGGFVEISEYRALCWTLLHPVGAQHFLGLHRVIARLVEGASRKYNRLEAYIDPEFSASVRWAKMLGFQCETENKPYYLPNGRAAAEWVRIRG